MLMGPLDRGAESKLLVAAMPEGPAEFDAILHVPHLLHVVGRHYCMLLVGAGQRCRVWGDSIQCTTIMLLCFAFEKLFAILPLLG